MHRPMLRAWPFKPISSRVRTREFAITSPSRDLIKPEEIQCDGVQNVDIAQFRALMKQDRPFSIRDVGKRTQEFINAIKWFRQDSDQIPLWTTAEFQEMNDSHFTFELILPPTNDTEAWNRLKAFTTQHAISLPQQTSLSSTSETFHTFYAPASLLQAASQIHADGTPHLPSLYMAQTQLRDLPTSIASAVPTPHLVLQADKGDIYDTNLWIGTPPTYTPLHKDPNPNLFIQLSSRKAIRIFSPKTGRGIFDAVHTEIWSGQGTGMGNAAFRGEEMMQGQERAVSDRRVWRECEVGGYEVEVEPGDAVYIPKGWWHSIKSLGEGVNASVNWWFR